MHTASYTSFIPGQAYLAYLLPVHNVADVACFLCFSLLLNKAVSSPQFQIKMLKKKKKSESSSLAHTVTSNIVECSEVWRWKKQAISYGVRGQYKQNDLWYHACHILMNKLSSCLTFR